MSDNSTLIQYINRQGGTLSPQLCYKTLELWQLAIKNIISLKGAYIAGSLNILRDSSVTQDFSYFGETDDQSFCFVSFHNKKMDIFCTWDHHPQSLAVDAFSMSWNQMFAYEFPPICLIPEVSQYRGLGQCQVILIAPQWPRRHWYPDLLEMCIANSIKLRLRQVPWIKSAVCDCGIS